LEAWIQAPRLLRTAGVLAPQKTADRNVCPTLSVLYSQQQSVVFPEKRCCVPRKQLLHSQKKVEQTFLSAGYSIHPLSDGYGHRGYSSAAINGY